MTATLYKVLLNKPNTGIIADSNSILMF